MRHETVEARRSASVGAFDSPADTPAPQRAGALEVACVTLLYLVGTGALTWPWLARLRTHIVGWPGDNFEFLWKLWWVPHRIGGGRTPFFAENVFSQSGGYHLGSTDMSPVATFLFAPLTAAAGPVFVYNVVMLLSYVLAGLGTYLLARRFGAGRFPALVAGAAFAYCPFHFVQATAHLNVAQIGFTPWVFLTADTLVSRRRLRDGVGFGLALAFAGLTTWYRLIFLVLTVPVFLLVRKRQTRTPLRRLIAPLAASAMTAAALVVPFALPAVSYSSTGAVPPFREAAFYSLSVEDYLMPPPGHPVTDYWTDEALRQGNYERFVYPGVVVVILALGCVAVPSLRRRGMALAAIAAVSALLSFGPVLRWFGRPVVVDVGVRAWTLHQVALEADPEAPLTAMAVPMPVYPIARYAPGLQGLRAWERAAEMTILAIDVMAALTLTLALRRLPRRAGIVAGIAALSLIVVDGRMQGDVLVEPAPRPVDRWLAAQPGRFRIIQMPYLRGQSGTQLYYSSFNGKDVALAQASVLPTTVTDAHDALVYTFPHGREWLGVLQGWHVRYVLVDEGLDPIPGLAEAMQGNGLRLATKQGSVAVFDVPREATATGH
jgi:hypothetical protein